MSYEIRVEKLINFIEMISLKGVIPTALIKFTKQGLKSRLLTIDNVTMTDGFLDKKGFEKYDEKEFEIGIKDTGVLLKILRTFNDVVKIEFNENAFLISNDERKAIVILASPSYITNVMDRETNIIERFNDEVEVPISILKNAVRNESIVGAVEYFLKVENNVLYIEVGEENFNKLIEKIKVSNYKNASVHLGRGFTEVVNALNNNVKLSFGNEKVFPLLIKTEGDDYKVNFVISPLKINEG